MRRNPLLLAPLLVTLLAPPAYAGGVLSNLFGRKPKPANQADAVTELVRVLRQDPDERRRAAAAEELRQYDPRQYQVLAPAIVDALVRDPSASVRAEAAETLGKVRPVTSQAGYALEQAMANDSSTKVRMAARQALWSYHVAGYRGNRPPGPQSSEPPLAPPGASGQVAVQPGAMPPGTSPPGAMPAQQATHPQATRQNPQQSPSGLRGIFSGRRNQNQPPNSQGAGAQPGVRETNEPPLAEVANPNFIPPPAPATAPSSRPALPVSRPVAPRGTPPPEPPLIPLDGLDRPATPPKPVLPANPLRTGPVMPPLAPAADPALPSTSTPPATPSKPDDGPKLNPPMA